MRGVGQPIAQPRIEEHGGLARADAAAGEHTAQHLRDAMLLADRQGGALVAGAQPPAPPQKAALDLHSIPLPPAKGFYAGHRDGPSRNLGLATCAGEM